MINKLSLIISSVAGSIFLLIKYVFFLRNKIKKNTEENNKCEVLTTISEINKDEQIRNLNGIDDVNKRLHKDAVD